MIISDPGILLQTTNLSIINDFSGLGNLIDGTFEKITNNIFSHTHLPFTHFINKMLKFLESCF